MREYSTFRLEHPGEAVTLLVMQRRKEMNNLSLEFLEELSDVLESLRRDDDCRVLVLTGEGNVFCAGADLKLMQQLTPENARDYLRSVIEVFASLDSFEKPTIAAINGYALGGGMEW